MEARDVGVLARAARASGHTRGAGAQWADDAARTMPMIHVTSSGDVTVGASVSDAFIRARIAGADETLSTGEQAVLSAITAEDSDALTTALAALPDADYDADWKAEARNLLRKRTASSAAPTGDGPLAQRAGEEILGLSRAGVRAYALSHTAIVDHVRAGDALSDAERAVLDAVLTKGVGSELEAALTALTGATYTTSWKNTVRQLAATYNAGDIQVDVTGGSIAAEGNGVEALYAVLHERNGAITVTVAEGARIVGRANGVHVRGGGATGGVRDQTVTVNGRVTGGTGAGVGVYLGGGGAVTVGATGEVGATSGVGILADGGDLTATVSGTVTGDVRVDGGGDLTANVLSGGVVTGTVHDPQASFTVVNGASIGRLRYTSGATVTVAGGGKLTGDEGVAVESTTGPLSVTVNDEGRVEGDLKSGGTLTATVNAGGVVTGTIHNPQTPYTVGNRVSIGRLLYANGATVTVAGGGTLTGVEVEGRTVAIQSTAGALSVTVNDEGRVEGDIESGGTLVANVMSGGVVTGTLHDPQASFTVGNGASIGRLLYASGGTVTVAGGGKLTGDEGVAAESTAGALSVTVNDEGRVEGDIESGGTLTVNVMSGGVVTKTIHDPQASFTVGNGASIGRILYASGGTVTVAGGGKLTGDEGVAAESTAGALSVTVNDEGRVEGDVKSGGTLMANVMSGGVVTGTLHDPQASFTVGNGASIGRLLYTSGGTVTVAATGRLTGVEVEGRTEALRSEAGDLDLSVAGTVTGDVRALGGGDLDATISGTVTGDVLGLGTGEHTVTVSNGGTVTGTVHLAASTVTVHGRAGRVRFDKGGTVTVGSTGWITGIEDAGRTEAIRNAAGDLVVSVAGRITGDIIDLGARPAAVTVEAGGTVTGSIDLSAEGSEVTVDGTAARVRLDGGGVVAVGRTGRIAGVEGVGIRSETGDLTATVAGRVAGDVLALGNGEHTVTVGSGGTVTGTVLSEAGELVVVIRQATGETVADAVGRVRGRIEEKGGRPQVLFQRAGEAEAMPVGGAPGTRSSAPVGAFDVGIVADEDGVVRLAHGYAPRSKVYEALPSVVLGLNRLPEFRDRMAAPRTADGAGWARVETFRGKWKADESVTPGLEYDYRRHGLKAGVDATVGGHGLLGVSLHHRRGTAEVPGGGDVKLSGHGVGMSGVWLGDAGYVDVQAEATWYEADFWSAIRGVLKTDVPGRGHALGVEVGRRVAVERLPAGMVLTPRAGLAHSRVSMGGFTDWVDARVSVEDGRSLKGRAGMAVEMEPGGASGSRVFGTVDVEHEFSRDTKVVVSGTELRSEAEATWLRLGLNGVHAWDEGRSTVQGGVSYATGGGGHELGGGVSLSVRF